MNQNNKKYLVLALAALPLLNSCNDSWLDPKPLSFYTPENTYVDAAGLYSALVACERNMRHEFFTDGAPILTEMFTADIAVHGKTDESGSLVDFDNEMLPARTKNDMKGKNGWYWAEGFKGIKYANIVISRLAAATFKDEAERNAVLGGAYFHRSYRYYKLTHQFGDVPWLSEEITRPKLDFYSYDRWSILEQCKKDMEFAYQWVPEQMDGGRANKDACGMLLMKICMSLGDFDRAIEIGKEVVARHPLMTQRFTANQNKPNTNLMHDLHSVEAKIDMSNTEGIMFVPDPTKTQDLQGGETPWYIYRSAETYLMMAECYYWKGDNANAASMLNIVRARAGAEPLTGTIGIAEVLAERARELYYEENRHVELVRISYLYAKTGKACEAFGGHTYTLNNFSGPGGTGTNNKDAGVNFYFDWVIKHNNFYNKGIVIPYGEYRLSVHHVLWPVPENAIKTNTGGVINQNIGYPGAENNISPLKVGEVNPETE